jgi:diguanylate cyclase (GGDEF)-like protein
MAALIENIAALSAERDRQALEVSVADTLFGLLQADSLSLWRVDTDKTVRRARLLANVRADEPVRMLDPLMGQFEWPLVDASSPMNACCQYGAVVQVPNANRTLLRSFVPVRDDPTHSTVVEIERATPLDAEQLGLIECVLKIYRNQIAMLDYSERDTLTGLNNRKTFENHYTRRVLGRYVPADTSRPVEFVGRRRMVLPGDQPWLAVMDIDFFKKINDRFGHVFGDEVLLMTSQLMRASFRDSDALFRFGGEEFVVLIPPTDPSGAETAFEHFRARIEAHDFPQVGKVTMSIGYTAARASDTASTVFERADEALYYAKQHGRNQSRCYESLVRAGELKDKTQSEGEIELF